MYIPYLTLHICTTPTVINIPSHLHPHPYLITRNIQQRRAAVLLPGGTPRHAMNYRPHDDAGSYCREAGGSHVFLVIGMMIVRRMGKGIWEKV
jgi:hypothetical protein